MKKPFTCPDCGRQLAHAAQLIDHMRIHTGEKPYECKLCGKQMRQRAHLTTHMRTHTGERPYKCKLCEKSYKQIADLRFQLSAHASVWVAQKSWSAAFQCWCSQSANKCWWSVHIKLFAVRSNVLVFSWPLSFDYLFAGILFYYNLLSLICCVGNLAPDCFRCW